jgi:cell division protein FtsA
VHTSVIPIGGLNLTADIAQGLRTPMAEAERIKMKYGCASATLIDPEETIEVPSVGGRQPRVIPRDVLVQIIEPRMEEIFQAVHHTLKETGYIDMLASGLVLCGGSTLLDGTPELAEQIIGLPARRASPIGVGGLADVVKSPAFATAVGLVKYGAEHLNAESANRHARTINKPNGLGLRSRLGDWFREVF